MIVTVVCNEELVKSSSWVPFVVSGVYVKVRVIVFPAGNSTGFPCSSTSLIVCVNSAPSASITLSSPNSCTNTLSSSSSGSSVIVVVTGVLS